MVSFELELEESQIRIGRSCLESDEDPMSAASASSLSSSMAAIISDEKQELPQKCIHMISSLRTATHITLRSTNRGSCFALYSSFSISLVMVLVSLALLSFDEASSSPQSKDKHDDNPILMILWTQIPVLQNLIHASLLGAAAMLVYLQLDGNHSIFWTFFARNVPFYFIQAAFLFIWSSPSTLTRFFAVILLVSSVLSLLLYQPLIAHDSSSSLWYGNTMKLCIFFIQVQSILSTVSVQLVQRVQADKTDIGIESSNQVSLFLFEASYGYGAHQALLLSTFMAARFYATDNGSIGAAILVSFWKTIMGIFSIMGVDNYDEISPFEALFVRFLVILDLSVSLIIFAASCVHIHSLSLVSMKDNSMGETDTVSSCCDNDDSESAVLCPVDEEIFLCPSEESRPHATGGLKLYLAASTLLLIELSVECVLLVSKDVGVEHFHRALGWGMHVCSIFLFCCVMALHDGQTYELARLLLAVACPAGSCVSLWQLWQLYTSSSFYHFDAQRFAWLLVARATAGFLQSLGLSLAPASCPNLEDYGMALSPGKLHATKQLLRTTLFYFYLPVFLLYTSHQFSSYRDVLRPFVASNSSGSLIPILVQPPPLYGLIFHFGILVPLFGAFSLGSAYKPSRAITCLFTAHLATLLLTKTVTTSSSSLSLSLEVALILSSIGVSYYAGRLFIASRQLHCESPSSGTSVPL